MLRMRTVLFACVLVLSGCAVAPSIGIESPNTKIPDDAGLVAVQVVNNSEQLHDFLSNWTAIFLIEEKSGAQALYLEALDSADLGTDVFVGALAPGRYRLMLLQAYRQLGDHSYRLRARVPAFIGHFEVASGRLTNLGTLIAQPLEEVQTDAGVQRGFALTRSDKPAHMQAFIRERLPDRVGLLKSNDELGWLPDSLGPLRQALLKLMVEKGLPRGAVQVGNPGELLAYGRLGQVYQRDADGQWAQSALAGEQEIYSAVRMADGHVALGGERGTFYIAQPPYRDFQPRPLPATLGPVYALQEAEPGTLVAVVLNRDHLNILASTDLGESWLPQARIVRDKPGFFYERISLPAVARLTDGTLLVQMDGAIHTRKPGSPDWQRSKGRDFTRFVAQRNGIWVGVPFDWIHGEGAPLFSVDEGQSWVKTGMRPKILSLTRGTPYIFSDRSILQPGAPQKFSMSAFSWKKQENIPLDLSTDNGQSFQPHGSVPQGCDRLRGEISQDDLLFLLCQDGRMQSSADGGRQFTLEFDPTLTSADIDTLIDSFAPATDPAAAAAAQ